MAELHQLKDFSAALAAELAMGLQPPKQIFANRGISSQEAAELLKNPFFADMVKQAKQDWESMNNMSERLRAKAGLALEEGLLDLYQILSNKSESAQARVAAAKELKDIAKVEAKGAGSGSNLPAIQIFLGGTEESVTVGGTIVENQPAGEDTQRNLRELFGTSGNSDLGDPEGLGDRQARQAEDPEKLLDVDFSALP